ncbi:hypothetical protein [Terasakiella pusilla]|uniref:hypothetical protein n=1 Tax=Terasakiella pusilla TaxID=64973 RepID=UPI003AA7FA2D
MSAVLKWIKKAKKLFSSEKTESGLVRIHDDGFLSDDIKVSIEDIVSDDDHEEIGKIFVLSLTEFHEAMGDTWDKREAKIMLLTESVLRQRIGAGNRWEHQSKEIFILIFPTLPEIEGAARTYDIAEELGLKIIGERFDGSKRPLIRVAGVDPKDVLTEDGKLDIEKLEQVGREGQAAGDAEKTPIQTKAGTKIIHDDDQRDIIQQNDISLEWQKNVHSHADHDTNWQKNKHVSQEHDLNWQKMQAQKVKDGGGPQWVSMSGTPEKKAANARPQAPTTQTATSAYDLLFAPCWDRAHQQLAHYKAVLTYDTPAGKHFESDHAYQRHRAPEQRLKMDIWVLQKAAHATVPLRAKKIVTPIFIPVHSSILRGDHKATFLTALQKIPEDIRKTYLILEVQDDSLWKGDQLEQTLQDLQDHVCALAYRPDALTGFKAPTLPTFSWVGIDLSALDATSGITPERIQALQSETQALGAKFYVFGINQRLQLAEFLDMGVDMIAGKALVRQTHKLRPPFALAMERLRA